MIRAFIVACVTNLLVLSFITALSCTGTSKTLNYPPIPELERSTTNKSGIIIDQLRIAYASTIAVMGQEGPMKDRVLGSGVVVKRRANQRIIIITNYHVVNIETDWNAIKITNKDNSLQRITRVLKADKNKDLAVLEGIGLELMNGPEVVLAQENPRLGEDIWVIGNPQGHQGNITHGVLSNYLGPDGKGPAHFRTDTAIFMGNSGGGAYNNRGELVGIARAVEILQQGPFPPTFIPGGGICITIEEVKKILVEIL